MKYEQIDNQLFINNRHQLITFLEPNSLVIIAANGHSYRNGDQYFPFRQHANFFYLCGIDQPNAILVLFPEHDNPQWREILFIDSMTENDRIWGSNKLTIAEAQNISGISTVRYIDEFETIISKMLAKCKGVYVDLIENCHNISIIQDKNFALFQKLQSAYPLHRYMRLSPMMEYLRLRKSPIEINLIERACQITADTFQEILPRIKPNMAEYEIEGEIYRGFLARKANGHSFLPIIASGKNACVLHYSKNMDICRDRELLLIDMGAEYANYAGDLSRTIPINGKFTQRQKELYQICERVFRFAITCYIPGMTCNKAQDLVLEKMQEELIHIGLIKQEDIENEANKYDSVKRYFMHGLAHFVGLDVHDVGDKDTVFDYGMVLSCEPGLYIPEEQIGIRIETLMLINDKPIDLMNQVPLSVEEIEECMSH